MKIEKQNIVCNAILAGSAHKGEVYLYNGKYVMVVNLFNEESPAVVVGGGGGGGTANCYGAGGGGAYSSVLICNLSTGNYYSIPSTALLTPVAAKLVVS